MEQFEFYLRPPPAGPHGKAGAPAAAGGPPTFLRVPLTIRIPGANCQHVLAEALATLFRHAGLPQRWHWGPEYWGSVYTVKEGEGREGSGDDAGGFDAEWDGFAQQQGGGRR